MGRARAAGANAARRDFNVTDVSDLKMLAEELRRLRGEPCAPILYAVRDGAGVKASDAN
ncbi:MAG: hypothetical protein HY678_10855 [Chloroflexi bacterium]|nr:hypothetical protein [Chloroflexota bacterium]